MKKQIILLGVLCSAAAGGAAGYIAAIPASRENASRTQQALTEIERQKNAEPERIPRTSFKVNINDAGSQNAGPVNTDQFNHDYSQKNLDPDAVRLPAADFLDKTRNYTGKEIALYMIADAAYARDMTLREILKTSPHYPLIFHLAGYKASGKVTLSFPIDLEVPATAIEERVLVRFRCSEGRIDSGNIVSSVERVEK